MRKALIIIQGLLSAFAAFFAVSLIYSFTREIFIATTGVEEINPQVDYCLMVLAVMVSIFVIASWYKKRLSVRSRDNTDLKKVFGIKNLCSFLMIGTGCQLFFSGALSLLRPLLNTLFSYYDETISSLFISDALIAGVYVVVLAPIIEELMLRGILFNRLRFALPFYAANLIQAVVFGIYHWDIIQGIYAFGIGLILGYIFEKTRTLYAPILVHMMINGSGFLIMETSIGQYIPVIAAAIAGGILLFGGLFSFYRNNKIKIISIDEKL